MTTASLSQSRASGLSECHGSQSMGMIMSVMVMSLGAIRARKNLLHPRILTSRRDITRWTQLIAWTRRKTLADLAQA